jgi:hypothetical protein
MQMQEQRPGYGFCRLVVYARDARPCRQGLQWVAALLPVANVSERWISES